MIYWIWLQQALGHGNNKLNAIINKFSSAEKVYSAGDEGRRQSLIFTERELRLMCDTSLQKAKSIYEKCVRENITVVTPDMSVYPKPLRNIPNPPFVLYVKGRLPDFDNVPCMCVVGPRKVTEYGYKCAYSISGRLCKAGFIIVSGGAMGSDAAAHQGALLNGGITVAILANGFGDNYLVQNEELRNEIMKKGCLITEYPPETKVNRGVFQQRNRIMSGLSMGVVIVEAAEKSGTLITARHAVEQNRDVFVIPGNPSLEQYKGSNKLLRDGAKPLTEINDILGEYKTVLGDKIDAERAVQTPLAKMVKYAPVKATAHKDQPPKIEKKAPSETEEIKKIKKILPETLSKNAKIIYNQLDKQIFTCDDLLSPTMNSSSILSALGELELLGFIKTLPGGRYTLSKR
ncbi:MAG: DNA-processing protein DprA [Acutalibacteraceae bacterium]|nr:DNA-processing protein DprA [Acutalibacteraceae bacterium]